MQASNAKYYLASAVWASLTMEHWQFLIQRQGDRAWHTLESPKVEIIEGRYRVLARSNRPNTDVEVRVTHSSTQELPPKRRIQKRSRRTNSEGLMAVIPYTYFQPGIWELQCSGDLMSDIFAKSWQYNLYLWVLAQDADGKSVESTSPDDYENIIDHHLICAASEESTIALSPTVTAPLSKTITAESSAASTEVIIDTSEDGIIDQPVSPVWVKGETTEQILQNLIELALPSSEAVLDDEMLTDPPATPALPPLLLNLDREAYVAHWGKTLTINGQIELKQRENQEFERPELESLYSVELRIDLRSPLGLEILLEVRQALPNEVLPFKIKSTIDIPGNCESKLILADINLYGALDDGGEVLLLGSQSFTITADVSELLAIKAAVTASKPDVVDETPGPHTPESSPSLDLSLLNLVKTVKPDESLAMNAVVKFLPPEIKPRSPKKSVETHSRIQLPNMPPLPPLSAIVAKSPTVELLTHEEILKKVETLAAINMDQLVIKNPRLPMISGTFPFLKPLLALPGEEEADTSNFHPPQKSTLLDVNLHEVDPSSEFLLQDEFVAEVALPRRSKLIDAYITEIASSIRPELMDDSFAEVATPLHPELIDDSVTEATTTPPRPQFIVEGNPYSSPLITQWLQSQGFSLSEPIHLLDQDYDMDVVAYQTTPNELVSDSFNPESPNIELNLSLNLAADMGIATDELAIAQPEIETVDNVSKEDYTSSLLESPPPPPRYHKIPLLRVTEEIVVDDTYIEPEEDLVPSIPEEEEKQEELPLVAEPSPLPLMSTAIVEPLPTPQVYLPEGELIAGTSVKVRVELPEVSSEVVVKLWIEDCQTRWLIDGPYILKDLLPQPLGGLEVKTQLHIPFGCLEMRVEAIALNLETQQESDKVSIGRAVIPPDLPTFPLDELLGI